MASDSESECDLGDEPSNFLDLIFGLPPSRDEFYDVAPSWCGEGQLCATPTDAWAEFLAACPGTAGRAAAASAPPRARAISMIARGLRALHEGGILHLDLKPENCLYETAAADATLKITDFGLAKHRDDDPAEERAPPRIVGTLGYMAPEIVLQRPATPAADVFSLGTVAFLLLSGTQAIALHGLSQREKLVRTLQCLVDFRPEAWAGVSPDAKVLCEMCRPGREKAARTATDLFLPVVDGLATLRGDDLDGPPERAAVASFRELVAIFDAYHGAFDRKAAPGDDVLRLEPEARDAALDGRRIFPAHRAVADRGVSLRAWLDCAFVDGTVSRDVHVLAGPIFEELKTHTGKLVAPPPRPRAAPPARKPRSAMSSLGSADSLYGPLE
ncbi:serine/threonine kinase [Aureococcus anophagefferens]|nr:serine/threonine kinase [Aureococcus anophagefferens]